MTETDRKSKHVSPEALVLFAVLACIAAFAITVLLLTWDESFEIEAAKAAMSVLGAAVFGVLATFALDRYRQRRQDDAQKQAEAERSHREDVIRNEERVAADHMRQEEDWRREVACLRDNRKREDIALRALLEETLRSYNRIKRARRLLRAYMPDSGPLVRLDFYDSQLRVLNDQQLRFEEFKRLTPAYWAERPEIWSLKEDYATIEKYLNKLVKEYEANRSRVESSGNDGIPLAQFERLLGFLQSHRHAQGRRGSSHDIGFEPNVSQQIDRIVEQVMTALLAPVEYPPVTQPPRAAPQRATQG